MSRVSPRSGPHQFFDTSQWIWKYILQPLAIQKYISSLAPALHTLHLQLCCARFTSPSSIFELNFPCLRSLSLAEFSEVDTLQAMAFWERHPSIEYLILASNLLRQGDKHWFDGSVLPNKFLPKLLHLRVQLKDALVLAPILGQLLSLSVHRSINA